MHSIFGDIAEYTVHAYTQHSQATSIILSIIDASLSEPHTSVTALRDACRCLVRPYTIFNLNERIRFCTCATLSARDRLRLER